MRANAIPRRAGMTLIELLIVMLIIAILASLSLSAVFTVRESQMKNFTEALINKLASALDGQWKATIDQIRDEPVPNWALTMANGDARIARIIYRKARLKQEFPVSFYQAMYPNANFTPGAAGAFQTPSGSAVDLPAKDAYRRALLPLVGTVIPNPPPGGTIPSPTDVESSALLYLALTQGRRGQAGFNPDEHVEPSAIQTRVIGSGAASIQVKILVDSWGNPVRLWTFPYGNAELNDTTLPYRNAFIQNQQSPDPQDPEQAFANYGGNTYPWSTKFAAMVHPTTPLRLLIPAIGSAGRDGAWGVDFFSMASDGSGADNDNICSYRLRRSGARGD